MIVFGHRVFLAHQKSKGKVQDDGFALVATISVMVLLVMIALAMLSLSTIELRQSRNSRYQEEAKANARMALMIAIGELQKYAGPDQRVTARAAILEDPSSSNTLANRNWLGVWKTTFLFDNMEWPLIGKAPDAGTSPYPHKGIYSDLRETEPSLKNQQWRDALHQGWLVSKRSSTIDPALALDNASSRVVELVGEGTLGNEDTLGGFYDAPTYSKNRVMVEKVDIESGHQKGAYAWYISDNNQKASIALDPNAVAAQEVPFLATQIDNISSVSSTPSKNDKPYADFATLANGKHSKLLTAKNAELVHKSDSLKALMRSHFHHFTTDGTGLFTDVVMGGFKKDLSPLLFGNPSQEIISFPTPSPTVSAFDFSTDTPIIPGPRHAVLGPNFGAIRYWGRMKYELDSNEEIQAQVAYKDASSKHARNSMGWSEGHSDGVTYEASKWASKAPKIHPVMTDVRWNYYFSHTEGDTNGSHLRTHIQPRVCLWNPYGVTVKTDKLMVLMPNPWMERSSFKFAFDAKKIEGVDKSEIFLNARPDENVYILNSEATLKPNSKIRGSNAKSYLFVKYDSLGFIIEPTTFKPGECLVFSPLVKRVDMTAGGISLQKYNAENIGANILSAKVAPGEDHFYHDYLGGFQIRTLELIPRASDKSKSKPKKKYRYRDVTAQFLQDLDFYSIKRYWPDTSFNNNFPYMLKSVDASTSVNVDAVRKQSQTKYPTLQLLNHGSGGVGAYNFTADGLGASNAHDSPFGDFLVHFKDQPDRQGARAHQWGAKLTWLDESLTEADDPVFGMDWKGDHIAFNPATIANWNIRPSLSTRSPSASCSESWERFTSGAWGRQYNPPPLNHFLDAPQLNDNGYFAKSPMGRANQFTETQAVMFDLPHPKYGALSLGALRHVQLSPYAWHPTYIIGNSLVNIHAPYETSANLFLAGAYGGNKNSSWDDAIGGNRNNSSEDAYGPRLAKANELTKTADSRGLLQIGSEATDREVEGVSMTSKDEVLPYDIAFEVNQNLWDGYYFSGIPFSLNGSNLEWYHDASGDALWNKRHQYNASINYHKEEAVRKLTGVDGLAFSFWNSAYFLKNKGSFNVNSTSVEAWRAFLSGLQGRTRKSLQGNDIGGGANSVFARVRKPLSGVMTDEISSTEQKESWAGGRILSEAEIKLLAKEIVKQVKLRGPFVSLADFVNRRLAPVENPSSMKGAIEEALSHTNLNEKYEKFPFLTTTEITNDNNHPQWELDTTKLPKSKAWGIPGYITQGDILEPMAPAMTPRGDSFTIRCYGESRDAQGNIKARAYLEALVHRTPEYIQPAHIEANNLFSDRNKAIDPALHIKRSTGVIKKGHLSNINQKFGRKYKIQSFKWLSPSEI